MRDWLRKPSVWIGAATVAFFGMLLYFLLSALLSPDTTTSSGQSQVEMRKVVTQGERGTQLGWRFIADRSEISTDGSVTTYHNVTNGTYYKNGKPAYHMTAGQLTLDTRTQNYTGWGGVHVWSVKTHDLEDIKTLTLSWNNPLQTLVCPTTVRVKYKGYALVTSHLTANLQTGTSTLGSTSVRGGGT